MKAPIRLLSLLALLACARSAFSRSRCRPDSLLPGYRHALALAVGTNGLGLEWATRSSPVSHWQYRLAVHLLGYHRPVTTKLNAESALLISPAVQLNVARAQADFHPFRRSSFHLTAGLAYALSPSYAAQIVANEGINYTGIKLSPDEFGRIDFALRWNRLWPYLGFGLGRAVPRRRVGVSADVGCFYLGSPRLSFYTDGLLDGTTLPDEIPHIERNLSGYRYLPALNVYLRYHLSR
jgi:hypothetical protein